MKMVNHPHRGKKTETPTETEKEAIITTVKGFDLNFQCRGFQYEIGKSYEHPGKVVVCPSESQAKRGEGGFHACEHPLDVLQYYPPATSRYALVSQSGTLARHDEDTKIASAKITIEAELQLPQIIERAVKWVFDRANWKDGPVATGPNEGATASGTSGAATASGYSGAATASGTSGAATASGDSGAATASGYSGAATASGYSGAATASGDSGAATASGTRGAATASGDSGAATASGTRGAATASGTSGRARGTDGCALFLVHRDDNWNITHAWAGIVGRDNIKSMTWYMLNADGKPVECD